MAEEGASDSVTYEPWSKFRKRVSNRDYIGSLLEDYLLLHMMGCGHDSYELPGGSWDLVTPCSMGVTVDIKDRKAKHTVDGKNIVRPMCVCIQMHILYYQNL